MEFIESAAYAPAVSQQKGAVSRREPRAIGSRRVFCGPAGLEPRLFTSPTRMRPAKANHLTKSTPHPAGGTAKKLGASPSARPRRRSAVALPLPLRTSSWMASMKPLSAPRWSWNCPRTKPDLSAYSTSWSMYSVSRSVMTGRRSFAFARTRTRALLSQSSGALLLRCRGQSRPRSGVDTSTVLLIFCQNFAIIYLL